jgi:AcrR family transcriptional regulator
MARPSKPLISRDNAVAAALAVIDEHGLSGFGLSAVAQRLGVKAPSLYHHFQSKEDLLSGVALSLLIEGALPPIEAEEDWIERIVSISLSSWKSVLRHPNAAVLLLQFMPASMMMGAYEHWAHYLAVNGVPSRLHLLILDGADKLTFGSILFTAQRRIEGRAGITEMQSERLPYLTQARAALGASTDPTLADEVIFAMSIRNYVHGVLASDAP